MYNNYSALSLWGATKLQNITTKEKEGKALYYTSHQKNILQSGYKYLVAANLALAYTYDVSDVRAKAFLLNDKVLGLYYDARVCFYKFITQLNYQQHLELNISIIASFLDVVAMHTSLSLSVRNVENYTYNINLIEHVNNVAKSKFSAKQVAFLFIVTANKYMGLDFPELVPPYLELRPKLLVALKLYDFALKNLSEEFYDNKKRPSDDVIVKYRELIEITIDLAYKTSLQEQDWIEYEAKYRQMQEMLTRLKELGININFEVGAVYAAKKIEPLPPTLRKRRPVPDCF